MYNPTTEIFPLHDLEMFYEIMKIEVPRIWHTSYWLSVNTIQAPYWSWSSSNSWHVKLVFTYPEI